MGRNLNPEQQIVVEHDRGPLRVGAVAGSGKTTALIERVAYLIEKRNVPPGRILMITFSRNARDEMKKRIDKRLPRQKASGCARTFHSIGLMIFTREADPNRDFELDTTGILYLKATERAYKSLSIEPERKAIIRFAGLVKNNMLGSDETMRRLGRVDARIMKIADDCCKESDVSAADMLQAFYRAEKIRTEGVEHKGEVRRFVTFDDMIYQTAMILKRDKVRAKWADCWSYILQDECQDMNEAQSCIAEALASKTRNYMIVGDPAQSIFGFRGSKPERMLGFKKEWPDAKTIVMHRNYRSGIEIVQLANHIMGCMPANTVITDAIGDATLMTSERQTHAYVGCHTFETSRDEAEAVANNIIEHAKAQVAYRHQAVLVRMNRMTRDIEIALATRRIPYKLVSGNSFFLMKEAKVLFGYLRVLLNRADKDAFKQCVMNPSRMLGNAFISKVSETHDMNKKDWIGTVSKVLSKLAPYQARRATAWLQYMERQREVMKSQQTPQEILMAIRTGLHLDDYFNRNLQDDEDKKSSDSMDAIIDFTRRFKSCDELLDLVEGVEKHRSANTRNHNAVTISTVHKAKGQEYPVVFMLQVAAGLFPADRAELTEERRCFYVGCTRAMDELWISRPLTHDGEKPSSRSRFVDEGELKELSADKYSPGRAIDDMRVGTQIGLGL